MRFSKNSCFCVSSSASAPTGISEKHVTNQKPIRAAEQTRQLFLVAIGKVRVGTITATAHAEEGGEVIIVDDGRGRVKQLG